MNGRSPHEISRNLSNANDLNKQNSPARQFYSDPRTMSKYNLLIVLLIVLRPLEAIELFSFRIFLSPNSLDTDARNSIAIDRRPGNIPVPHRPMNLGLDMTPPRKMQQPQMETKTDYGKYR